MTARTSFYHHRPLNEDQLRKIVPSIFTVVAAPDRSERFTPIPTIDAVRALAKEGFEPYGASQSRSRKEGGAPYVKHLLKFRKEGNNGRPLHVGDNILEVVIANANDGTKGYSIDSGFFRVACLNGLIIKSQDFGSAKVRHVGGMETLYRVLEASHDIVSHAEKAMAAPQDWSKIIVDEMVRNAFAKAAHHLRFGDDDRITAKQLLIPRREADMGRDLWSLLNVVQENVVEGGLSQISRSPGASRTWTTRRVGAVDANLRINRQIWGLAERVAKGDRLNTLGEIAA